MESSSPSYSGSSSKRAKALASIGQVANCLVDGCTADLSLCRDYHRRHKVCEVHSKTPKVTIAGREQRFCQQCSRFHSLSEFDEGKRSCRKRLDGHNRRRRKPQPPQPLPLPRSAGLDFCSQQGTTRLMSFGGPPQVVGYHHHPWSSEAVKTENDLGSMQQQQQQQQLGCMEASSLSLHNYALFVDPNGGNHKMFPDMADSGGALSLLSSPAPNAATSAPSMDYAHYHQTKLDVSSSGASTLHFPHHAPDQGSSHQTLSFMWE